MKYLLKRLSPKQERRAAKKGYPIIAHLWDGVDTLCHMWTTGGIVQEKRYVVTSDPEGRPICKLCAARAVTDGF